MMTRALVVLMLTSVVAAAPAGLRGKAVGNTIIFPILLDDKVPGVIHVRGARARTSWLSPHQQQFGVIVANATVDVPILDDRDRRAAARERQLEGEGEGKGGLHGWGPVVGMQRAGLPARGANR